MNMFIINYYLEPPEISARTVIIWLIFGNRSFLLKKKVIMK